MAAAGRRRHAGNRKGEADTGQQHQVHADREGGGALVQLQGSQRGVAGDQRRRAGGVVRDARALQTEHKREAAGRDRHRPAGGGVHAPADGRLRRDALPVVGGDAEKDARQAAAQRRLVHARAVQRLVASLEEQPLLRVDGGRLGGRDAEASIVEELGAAQEAAVPHSPADDLLHAGQRSLHRPPLRRHLTDAVAAASGEVAQLRRRRDAARQAGGEAERPSMATAADGRLSRWAAVSPASFGRVLRLLLQVARELARRRVVEDERRRQRRARHRPQLVAELDRAERVEPRLHQRRVGVRLCTRRRLDHLQDRLERHRPHLADPPPEAAAAAAPASLRPE